ncbi:MAG: hypothetical protein CFE24_14540, partial [Flavobacterium sp. BFFFF2]
MKRKFLKYSLFLLIISFSLFSWAQNEPNDCVNAITVCSSDVFSSNASGIGNAQEINFCGGGESNSIWIKFTAIQSGNLGFDLIPTNPDIQIDYDFWVFGPNKTCGNLGNPIRCSTTNPEAAGATTNYTGMNSSSSATQQGPGAQGTGYVKWLTVTAGQTYYLAIDRPVGDSDFNINWIGTPNLFSPPPAISSVPDQHACETLGADQSSFDLSLINSIVSSTPSQVNITYHESASDALTAANPISITAPYLNTSNPQTLYIRVTDPATSCFSMTNFQLVVDASTTAQAQLTTAPICSGENYVITLQGTPGATVSYIVDTGNTQTIVLSSSGSAIVQGVANQSFVFHLVSSYIVGAGGVPLCQRNINQDVQVTIQLIPFVNISGTTQLCLNNQAPVTFTGTPDATVIYNINGGANQQIQLDANGLASLISPALTSDQIYSLVSIQTNGIPSCNVPAIGTATLAVIQNPTASISSLGPICAGSSSTLNFTGTPNGLVTYLDATSTAQNIQLDNAGVASVSTGVLLQASSFTLSNITVSGTPSCSQSLSGFTTVIVLTKPDGSIGITTPTVCQNDPSAEITFSGVAGISPFTFIYTLDGGAPQTLVSLSTTAQLSVPTQQVGAHVYQLLHIQSSGPVQCETDLSQSVTLTVLPSPTANISASSLTVCEQGPSPLITFTGLTGQSPFTFLYELNGQPQSIQTQAGLASIDLPVSTLNPGLYNFNLIRVTDGGVVGCSQNQSSIVAISVESLPSAHLTLSTPNVCANSTLAKVKVVVDSGTAPYTIVYTDPQNMVQTLVTSTISTELPVNTSIVGPQVFTLQSITSGNNLLCSSILSNAVTLNVTNGLQITVPPSLEICDDNNDGFSCDFQLSNLISSIIGTNSNWLVSFHETMTDAENGVNPIPLNGYCSINPWVQTIYILVKDPSLDCPALSSYQIIVHPQPIVAIPSVPYALCDDNTDGAVAFDLTGYGPTILDTLLPADYTVSYYLTEAEALAGTGALTGTNAYVSISKTIYVRVQNNLTGCFKVVPLALQVNPLPILPFPLASYNLCDYVTLGDNQEPFDLDGQSPLILNGQTGIAVSFYQTAFDAQGGDLSTSIPSPYTAGPVQTIHVRAQNTTTGCFRTSTMDIRVNPLPQLVPMTLPLTVCDSDQDGV